MILLVLLSASAGFTVGWALAIWMCSRDRDCPRYAMHTLEEWKKTQERELESRAVKRPRPRNLTPPEGGGTT